MEVHIVQWPSTGGVPHAPKPTAAVARRQSAGGCSRACTLQYCVQRVSAFAAVEKRRKTNFRTRWMTYPVAHSGTSYPAPESRRALWAVALAPASWPGTISPYGRITSRRGSTGQTPREEEVYRGALSVSHLSRPRSPSILVAGENKEPLGERGVHTKLTRHAHSHGRNAHKMVYSKVMSTLHAHAPRPSRGGAEPHLPCLIQ